MITLILLQEQTINPLDYILLAPTFLEHVKITLLAPTFLEHANIKVIVVGVGVVTVSKM